jgi:hypothetical protein
VDNYGLSWIIVDDHGLQWLIMFIMDYHGLWTIPEPLKAKAVMTAQWYGAARCVLHPFAVMDYHG